MSIDYDSIIAEYGNAVSDMQNTINTQGAEIARLRAALEPFAKIASMYAASHEISSRHHRDERGIDAIPPSDSHQVYVNLGHCRRAQEALGK